MKADDLRRKREQLGLTQEELAKHLGVKRLSVIRWENGQTEIDKILERAMRDLERELR
jgi:transcriptional regulator with XRE-family HTH domain